MSLLVTELKKVKLQSELITISRTSDYDELTGFISSVNDTITSMHLYENDGIYDGFTIFETHQIDAVWWNNREHKAIAHHVEKDKNRITPKLKSRALQNIILELNSSFDSLEIYKDGVSDSFDVGKIEDHDGKWFKLDCFGNRNTLSRQKKIYLREEISRVVVNSPYQNQITELHKTKL